MLGDSVVVEERVKANVQEIANSLELQFDFRLFHRLSIGLCHQRIEESHANVASWNGASSFGPMTE